MKYIQKRTQRLALLVLMLSVTLSGLLTASYRSAEAALPWQDKGSPFGMVATLGNRVRGDEMPAAVDLMREAGVQWQREEIFWDRVQKSPDGPFVWNGDGSGFYDYDRAIRLQVEAGINVLGLLDYNPYWFKSRNPHPDEWIEDWGDFVYAAVAHYGRDRGWIKYWELWNEPNLAGSGYESGLYEVQDFVRLLEVGRAAARAADPEARIVMGGMASIWGTPPSPYNYDYFTYLELVGELGGWQHVDVIAIHPYRPDAPEGDLHGRSYAMDLRTELRALDEMLLRFGSKPIWITEMGWSTKVGWPGVGEDTQAFFLVRFFILAITHPSVEKVFWYDLRNDSDPNAPYDQPAYNVHEEQFHYGLLRRSYPLDPLRPDLRKPAFLAYRAMTQKLAGLWLREIISEDDRTGLPGVYWYAFGDTTRRVDVLWRVHDASPIIEINCGCREALVRNWRGEVKHLVMTGNGTLQVRLDEPGAPMYIEYDAPVQGGGEYFDVTGHTIRGAFRAHWHANGGVERFGYPLTEELIIPDGNGRPRVVQYFERARFEHFPEYSGSPDEISLSRLGDSVLLRRGIDWQTLPRVSDAPEACVFYEDVGHSICPPFRAVWEQYGALRGVGLPLTEAYEATHPETGDLYIVQYFERARLERYPSRAGTPQEFQFGAIGREYLVSWGAMP